jgi:very-short-patch-repair endonuclease
MKLNKLGFARYLRQRQTETEKLLWFNLRNKKLNGIKFKRQSLIGPYIVDFVSFKKMLVIELDEGQHNSPNVIVKDKVRTAYLERLGFKVVRYWDNEVFNQLDAVLEDILEKASTSP